LGKASITGEKVTDITNAEKGSRALSIIRKAKRRSKNQTNSHQQSKMLGRTKRHLRTC